MLHVFAGFVPRCLRKTAAVRPPRFHLHLSPPLRGSAACLPLWFCITPPVQAADWERAIALLASVLRKGLQPTARSWDAAIAAVSTAVACCGLQRCTAVVSGMRCHLFGRRASCLDVEFCICVNQRLLHAVRPEGFSLGGCQSAASVQVEVNIALALG